MFLRGGFAFGFVVDHVVDSGLDTRVVINDSGLNSLHFGHHGSDGFDLIVNLLGKMSMLFNDFDELFVVELAKEEQLRLIIV